jgi:hypothetical protein
MPLLSTHSLKLMNEKCYCILLRVCGFLSIVLRSIVEITDSLGGLARNWKMGVFVIPPCDLNCIELTSSAVVVVTKSVEICAGRAVSVCNFVEIKKTPALTDETCQSKDTRCFIRVHVNRCEYFMHAVVSNSCVLNSPC